MDRLSDRYEIEAQIASGGMGTVYRARDERLQRVVAIKVLKDHLAHDVRFVERFRREALAVASLSHPNIASLFDYGEDNDRHYIVMEYVAGRDLASVLREEGALEPERAQRIIEQVCSALVVAHANDIVHRDIKPGNVLLSDDDTAKVTDFGIARAAGDSTLTATGSILGTAHYLAPEQAAGDPATSATDVYATGVLLFEMLTGRVPFTADSPVAVAARHMNDEVPAPSSVSPSVPPRLDEIVKTATAKNPVERYGDAAAMGAALRGVEPSDTTTEVLPAGSDRTLPLSAPTSPISSPRRAFAWAAATLVLLALALLAFRLVEDSPGEKAAGSEKPQMKRSGTPTPDEVALVTVPKVIGLPVDDAVAELTALELVPRVDGKGKDAAVAAVEPPPGSEEEPGTTITLTVIDEGDLEGEDDEGGPPPHANSKAKGKDKDKEKDD